MSQTQLENINCDIRELENYLESISQSANKEIVNRLKAKMSFLKSKLLVE
jgi:hypothetical protein